MNAFYSGDYRDAERGLRRLTRSGVRAGTARWIDAICYHAFLGEVLFHEGRSAEALAEFDQACLMLTSYPTWMQRVKFEDLRADANLTRRQAPWATSERRFVLGNFPHSMQVLVGDAKAAQNAVQKGGVYLQPQFWRVNVIEIVRASALAIRRRNEILGPLGKYDRISKELAAILSRGNFAPPNHWSQGWAELLAGVAQEGVGKADEARAHLSRAVIVGGQFDHPLTGVALLEQGRLALAAGDHRAAAQLLGEASISGRYYDDSDVIAESLTLGWTNHLASGVGGAYGPLEAAAAWAQANRLWHVAAKLRTAEAENRFRMGQLPQAGALIEETLRRSGDMRNSRVGIKLTYLQSLVELGQGKVDAASETLNRALTAESAASLRNFQIARASELYDGREISPRIALDLFQTMLEDPKPADWTERTLETLAVMRTPHEETFGRWFLAALERKDIPLALEVSERTKRARFLAAVPLGGRLLALRTILEAPANELSDVAAMQKQQLLANFPEYRDLSAAAGQLYQQLRAGPVIAHEDADARPLNRLMEAWNKNVAARERILLSMALSPEPTAFLFPPLRSMEELQQSLAEGEALVVFHAVAGNLYGFVLSNAAEHVWQLGEERQVQRAIGDFLRLLGNFGPNRELTNQELKSDAWQDAAQKLNNALFADARLDLANTTGLVIVPDSWLWYCPFETLMASDADSSLLVDRVPIHYGPMASLAVGDTRPFRRTVHTGIVAGGVAADEKEAGMQQLAALEDVVTGPLRMRLPLPEPGYLLMPLLDELVALDDIEVDRKDPFGWSPFAKGRKNNDSINDWMGLPFEGPERMVLVGFPTAAETGLKPPRRGDASTAAPGSEVFNTVTALMASGARTVLLSRWRTGGQTNLQLVREFVQELPNAAASDAWQRSIMLARESPLDAAQEPRLKKLDDSAEPQSASHPFFWAGYLLVDTGMRTAPESDEVMPPKADAANPDKADAKPAPQPNGQDPAKTTPNNPPRVPVSSPPVVLPPGDGKSSPVEPKKGEK